MSPFGKVANQIDCEGEDVMRNPIGEGRDILWPGVRDARLGSGQGVAALRELSISGDRVLVALGVAVAMMGPLLWTFVRYWLFAP